MKAWRSVFAKTFLVVSLVSLFPTPLAVNQKNHLIVWNVGQGQWITVVTDQQCIHFDAGGEFWDRRRVSETCRHKPNRLFISHTDRDHIVFLPQLLHWPKICLEKDPPLPLASPFYRRIQAKFNSCPKTSPSSFPLWRRSMYEKDFLRRKKRPRLTANDLSSIFKVTEEILLPGDATARAEKIWSRNLPAPEKVLFLVASHHGSRTSSSTVLLDRLANLKLVLASARREVYGHPHPIIIDRFRKKSVPLLSTEEWGHLRIDLE